MKKNEDEIFTFKADREMAELLENMPNRSAFIREAIVSALEVRCPLCQGNGILTPIVQVKGQPTLMARKEK